MYSDEDGVATKESTAVYNARVKKLTLGATYFSFFGFATAIFSGEYAKENLNFPVSLKTSNLLNCGKLLWVSHLCCALIELLTVHIASPINLQSQHYLAKVSS